MSSSQTWRVEVRKLETKIRIGIREQERVPQRVWVDAVVEGVYPSKPESIADCFNYELIHKQVVQEWPKLPHVDLIETRVAGLLEFIFRADARVCYAKVSLSKPDIFAEAESVGVSAEWTREDFERNSERN